MKIFCISGAVDSDLAFVQDIFMNAGVHRSKPARFDPSLDMAAWHDQVFASAGGMAVPDQAPGRLWEQLAAAIFVENIVSPCWAWADSRSTWLLDFWHGFEHGIHFVLVYTSPQRALGLRLHREEDGNAEAMLSSWHAHHQQMLRFYLRHPQRTFLVDAAECEAAPREVIAACASRWGLTSLDAKSVSAVSPTVTPLANYLAQQLCQSRPDVIALQHELEASLHRPAGSSSATGLMEAVQDFSRCQWQLRQDASLRQQLRQVQDELAQARRDNDALADLTRSNEADAADCGKRLDWTEQQRRELTQQLQTHHATLQERDQLRSQLRAVQSGLAEGEKENAVLLRQLHQVQEELEQYFIEHHALTLRQIDTEARWQRMTARNPDYADHQAIHARVGALTPQGVTIDWEITMLVIEGRVMPAVRFATVIADSVLQFVFDRAAGDAASGLLRWPDAGADKAVLAAHEAGPETVNNTLARLAPSDVRLLRALCSLLDDALEQDAVKLDGIACPALLGLLRRFSANLRAQPPVLRFDSVTLRREQVNADYEHLWMRMEQVELGTQRLPHFEFRLSCADVTPQRFGSHPKLEFPAQDDRPALASWFAESSDDFGDKLELRFALPDAMDLAVWGRLSAEDQAFLTALLGLLPSLLDELEHQGTVIARSWNDWRDLVRSVQQIHRDRTVPLANRGAGIPAGTPAAAPAAAPATV